MNEKSHRRLAIVHEVPLPGLAGQVPVRHDVPVEGMLQVGDLAKASGKTVRAIHLYEDMGLLRPAQRSKGRFRLYNADSIERVSWISKMQAVGFSLPELKELLAEQGEARTGKQAARILRAAYLEKLDAVQSKLAQLHRLERELLSSLTYLDACQTACDDHTEVESCPDCSRHIDQPEPPSLVIGAHVR